MYILFTVPAYQSKHKVLTAPWSYPEDIVSQVISVSQDFDSLAENERSVDLRRGPPMYEENTEYIAKLKKDLGIKVRSKNYFLYYVINFQLLLIILVEDFVTAAIAEFIYVFLSSQTCFDQ